MKRDRIPPRSAFKVGEDPIEWLAGSLGARFPRVEDQFCNAAQERRKAESLRVRAYKESVK